MSDLDVDLVPPKLRGLARAHAEREPLPVGSPLPEVAAAWYTAGGCWSLALALNDATGLPIEVYVRANRMRHAYVVDEGRALDAFGWRARRFAQAGADESREVTPSQLRAALADEHGPDVLNLLDDAQVQSAAQRTAALLLGSGT